MKPTVPVDVAGTFQLHLDERCMANGTKDPLATGWAVLEFGIKGTQTPIHVASLANIHI